MLIWQLTILASYFVKGVAGFGNSLVHLGIMAYFRDNAELASVDPLLTAPANVVQLVRFRKYLNRRKWLPVTLVMVLALLPGALLLRYTDPRIVKLLFGPAVILLGLNMLRPAKEAADVRSAGGRIVTWGLVILAGIMSGMFGIGALITAAMGRMTSDMKELKANLSAAFVADNACRLVIYAFTGILTRNGLLRALQLTPAMALGLLLGMACAGRISEHAVRLCVVAVLVASGILLIVNNL